jgi:hypothetical protein
MRDRERQPGGVDHRLRRHAAGPEHRDLVVGDGHGIAVIRLGEILDADQVRLAEMPPLPIFLSYRDDPGSALTRTVVDALLGFKALQPGASKKSMRS